MSINYRARPHCRAELPSREGWPVVWVHSALLALRQEHSRRERLVRAIQELGDLDRKLTGTRPRWRSRHEILERVESILQRNKVVQYLRVKTVSRAEYRFTQTSQGRPGPQTSYRRLERKRWRLEWTIDEEKIAYDRKSDGMYPLLTNDTKLTSAQILEAHKRQPTIEKRFEQAKTVFEIAPVLLKNEGRIEALFFVYFLALLVQALIERELRRAMKKQQIPNLPLYPEERRTSRPTAEQIFKLFSLLERHYLQHNGVNLHLFEPQLTDLQRQILNLLAIPETVYRTSP